MRKLTSIEKAQRYVDNAQQVLLEKGAYDSEIQIYENEPEPMLGRVCESALDEMREE